MSEQLVRPGAIVRCRDRDWVLLPSSDTECWYLRPLTGAKVGSSGQKSPQRGPGIDESSEK